MYQKMQTMIACAASPFVHPTLFSSNNPTILNHKKNLFISLNPNIYAALLQERRCAVRCHSRVISHGKGEGRTERGILALTTG